MTPVHPYRASAIDASAAPADIPRNIELTNDPPPEVGGFEKEPLKGAGDGAVSWMGSACRATRIGLAAPAIRCAFTPRAPARIE